MKQANSWNSQEEAAQVFALVREMLAGLEDQGIEVSTQTRSMVPLLEGADRIYWRRCEGDLNRGDLLIYYQRPAAAATARGLLHRSLVVHRLIRQRRDGALRTKGDGRPGMDLQDVPREAVLGVVTRVRRGDATISLEGTRARRYALLATWVSAFGAGGYQVASYGDAVLRRLLPGFGNRRVFRAPAWWVQKLAALALHAVLAPPCAPGEGGPA